LKLLSKVGKLLKLYNMKKSLYLFCGLIILFWVSAGQLRAAADFEYWSKYNLTFPLKGKFSLYLEPQFKFLDNVGFYYFKGYVGPIVTLNKKWKLAFLYAYKDKKKKNIWEKEDLLYLDGVSKLNLGKVIIDTRLRGEYSLSKEEWVTRVRVKLSKNKLLKFKALQPFIEEEIFYNFRSKEFYENRASLGITFKFQAKAKLSLSYLLNSKLTGQDWNNTNVLVSSISIEL
jgi:hypothetical protein